MNDMRPESVVSSPRRGSPATALEHVVNVAVCSPALSMRMIMLGKWCLPSAAEMPSPRSMSGRRP